MQTKIHSGEVASKADFSQIRYAQCWEDSDILLEGLAIQPGERCLSIASAGDNAIAMLLADPERVIAVDLNPSQLHCVALRVAAYRTLEYEELLELIGSRLSDRREGLYRKCRPLLSEDARRFWDSRLESIHSGIGGVGKFENYFECFRKMALPLVHSRKRVGSLLEARHLEARRRFYSQTWNTWRWRLLFRCFFSRFVMGRLGRDPSFFDYVEGSVGDRILERAKHALTELAPHENPYLQWILTGMHGSALPTALRRENFDIIRSRIERIECRLCSIEAFCDTEKAESVSRFNLSDIFEYMSEENYHRLLSSLLSAARPGGRLAYWNMLAPRARPESMAESLRSLDSLSQRLFQQDKAFFYSRFIVEEVQR